MRENVKKIFYVVIGLLLICAYIYVFLVEPVIDLTNKKDLKTVNIESAYNILTVEHSINGLIPIGKEYFYVGIVKDSNDAYLIRASKKWLDKNFKTNYQAINDDGFSFTALPERISDFDITDELNSRLQQVGGYNYPLGYEYCLEYSYQSIAVKKLILFVFSIILVIVGIILAKKNENANSKFGAAFIVAILVFLALMITTMK